MFAAFRPLSLLFKEARPLPRKEQTENDIMLVFFLAFFLFILLTGVLLIHEVFYTHPGTSKGKATEYLS